MIRVKWVLYYADDCDLLFTVLVPASNSTNENTNYSKELEIY